MALFHIHYICSAFFVTFEGVILIMNVELLNFISDIDEKIREESINKLLETIAKPETIPNLFEMMNFFYVSMDFTNFAKIVFLLQRIIKTSMWLNVNHLLSLLDNLIYFLCIVPINIGPYIIQTIDLILDKTNEKFLPRIKKVLKFFTQSDKENEQVNCLMFLAKYAVSYLISINITEERINQFMFDEILPKMINTVKTSTELSDEYYIASADLISSAMKVYQFIPPQIEELGLLLIKQRNCVILHLLESDDILLWPGFNIFEKLKQMINSDQTSTHIKSLIIESLISFLQSESTNDEVISFINDTIFDLDIDDNEREYEDEVEFEMNVNSDYSQNSYRGLLLNFVEVYLNLYKEDENIKQKIDLQERENIFNLYGFKLCSNKKQLDSIGFGYLIKAKLLGLNQEENDSLIHHIQTNFSATCLIALFYSNRELAVSTAKNIETNQINDKIFSIALDFITQQNNLNNKTHTTIDLNLDDVNANLSEWEKLAKSTDEDEIPDFDSSSDESPDGSDEGDSDLEKLLNRCTKIINSQSHGISIDFARELVNRVIPLVDNYRYSYCDSQFAELLKSIMMKCNSYVENITQLFPICEKLLSEEGELNDNLIELLCYISSRPELDLSTFTINIMSICNEIIGNKMAQSAAPFILLSILIQKNELINECANVCFPYFSQENQEEEWFAGSVILLSSALFNDESFKVPNNVIDFWLKNVDFVHDQQVLKYSLMGLSILSKRKKYEGIDLALKLITETEADNNILSNYMLPLDKLLTDGCK